MTYRARCTGRLVRKNWLRAKRWIRNHKRTMRRPSKSGTTWDGFFAEQREHGAKYGDGWHGEISGACPVQGLGEVDGVPWYFRSRGEHWSLEIGVGEGSDGELAGTAIFERSGTHGRFPDAGWMGAKHAWSLIKRSIGEFRAERRRQA